MKREGATNRYHVLPMALSAASVAPPDAPSVVVRGVLFIIATESKLQHFLTQVVVFFPSHSSPSFRRIIIGPIQRF
jgi:hypothetical protein